MRAERVRRVFSDYGIDRTAIALGALAILLFGAGSTWGLPHATNELMDRGWDVDGVAGIRVLSEFHNLLIDPKPDWYTAYPLLHYLILGAIYVPYLAYLLVTGAFSSPSPEYPYGFADPVGSLEMLALLARGVTLLMAAGTVMATYAAAKLLWGRGSGVIAAAIFGLSGPVVYYARTSNLDIPVMFWTAIGIVVLIRILQSGMTLPRAIALGLFAALSVGTKDQAYGAWLPAIAVVLFEHWRTSQTSTSQGTQSIPWIPVVALIGTGLVAFGAANGVFIRPSRFILHLEFITGFEKTFPNLAMDNQLTIQRPSTLLGYLGLIGDAFRATALGMSHALTLLGITGAVVVWRKHPHARVFVWMGIGFVVLVLFPLHHMQYRYTLLPIQLLALLGAGAFAMASSTDARLKYATTALVVVSLAWQAFLAVDLTYQMRADARYAAGEWIRSEVPSGSSIGYFGAMHQLPHLPKGVRPVQLVGELDSRGRAPQAWPEFILVAPDYYADPDRVRSAFLPEVIYERLHDESLGYRRVGYFITPSLSGKMIPYLPYVNPQVQIFSRRSGS